jgi:hypothetical protein
MHVTRMIRWSTSYRVKAAAATTPHLLLEHLRHLGATLTSPDPKTIELTADAYRIPLTLSAKGEGGVTVTEDQPIEETIRLLDIDDSRLGVLLSSGEIDAGVRQALSDIAVRRAAAGPQRAELGKLKEQRAQLVEDQNRLRNNISVLGNDAALKKRLLDKFSETETAIETVTAATAKATDALAAAERDLASYIAKLTL